LPSSAILISPAPASSAMAMSTKPACLGNGPLRAAGAPVVGESQWCRPRQGADPEDLAIFRRQRHLVDDTTAGLLQLLTLALEADQDLTLKDHSLPLAGGSVGND